VNAIACVGGCVDEQQHDAVLIFEIEFNDIVIITTVKVEMDVPPSITPHLEETAKDTSCLLVGRSIVDKTGNLISKLNIYVYLFCNGVPILEAHGNGLAF
jgi:hypothetical protein